MDLNKLYKEIEEAEVSLNANTLSFNWDSYEEKITQEEFDDFVNKVDRSQLPEDIRFELK